MERRRLREPPLSRRDFLRGAAGVGLAGTGVVLLGACGSRNSNGNLTGTSPAVGDAPPETTTIRLGKTDLPRLAPIFLAEQFLPAEGFTDVQFVEDFGGVQQLASGEIDIGLVFASSLTAAADASDQLVVLAGVHSNLFEISGNDGVQSLRDLKGKRLAGNRDATDPAYSVWAALLAYVDIDIRRDVEFVEFVSGPEFVRQILAGEIDAWLLTRPASTQLRNANIGHVVVDAIVDPPWSQYFGGMAAGNRDFVEQNPAATKRALRAILKATDVCAKEPERAARYLVDKGYTDSPYELALDGIPGRSFAVWREFNPEDSLRFYALRLREAGLVKGTPDELIARATDWRMLDEIKRELAV